MRDCKMLKTTNYLEKVEHACKTFGKIDINLQKIKG